MSDIVRVLAVNAALSALVFLALWRLAAALKDVSFVDAWWGLGMGLLAVSTALQVGGGDAHRALLTGLTLLWAIRLAAHLLARWRREGPDRRYTAMLQHAQTERGMSFETAAGVFVFATQAPLQFIVALPAQLGQIGPQARPLGPLAAAGCALFALGFLFETIGDLQLTRFKRDPAMKGRVLDTGLWRFTRHPNYFGDACVWWGLFLIAAETRYGPWALPGPLLLTWTLARWSGAPLVESRLLETRPDYADYVRRTSGFIPMPPRRRRAGA